MTGMTQVWSSVAISKAGCWSNTLHEQNAQICIPLHQPVMLNIKPNFDFITKYNFNGDTLKAGIFYKNVVLFCL